MIKTFIAAAAVSALLAPHGNQLRRSAAMAASRDTMPFTTHGGQVRVVFTVQPNSSGPVPFLDQMFP
jgi:hypothetical protein